MEYVALIFYKSGVNEWINLELFQGFHCFAQKLSSPQKQHCQNFKSLVGESKDKVAELQDVQNNNPYSSTSSGDKSS